MMARSRLELAALRETMATRFMSSSREFAGLSLRAGAGRVDRGGVEALEFRAHEGAAEQVALSVVTGLRPLVLRAICCSDASASSSLSTAWIVAVVASGRLNVPAPEKRSTMRRASPTACCREREHGRFGLAGGLQEAAGTGPDVDIADAELRRDALPFRDCRSTRGARGRARRPSGRVARRASAESAFGAPVSATSKPVSVSVAVMVSASSAARRWRRVGTGAG